MFSLCFFEGKWRCQRQHRGLNGATAGVNEAKHFSLTVSHIVRLGERAEVPSLCHQSLSRWFSLLMFDSTTQWLQQELLTRTYPTCLRWWSSSWISEMAVWPRIPVSDGGLSPGNLSEMTIWLQDTSLRGWSGPGYLSDCGPGHDTCLTWWSSLRIPFCKYGVRKCGILTLTVCKHFHQYLS